MGTPPLSFTGFSDFSDSFQEVLQRTFDASQLPIKRLETERDLLEQRQKQLNDLSTSISKLDDGFRALATLAGDNAITGTSTNPSVATAKVTGLPEKLSFVVDVTSVASEAQEATLQSLPSKSSGSLSTVGDGQFTLTVGSTSTDITLTGANDSLEGLQSYINSHADQLGVKATMINTSSNPNVPAYRLTFTALETGQQTLRLRDSNGTDLLSSDNQGSNAVFEVNGVRVTNPSNTIVDFIPGLDLRIHGSGVTSLSTGTDRGALSQGLHELVDAYNAAVTMVQSHVGKNAGLLSGSMEIRQAQQTLREITSFFSANGLNSMREIGLDLQQNGQLQVNNAVLTSLTPEQLQGAFEFIGDLSTGFAGNATKLLGNLTNPVSGQFARSSEFLQESDDKITEQIRLTQERVDRMIANLENRFAQADLLLSQLEEQQDALTQFLDAQANASKN